jgi:tetratricopeptide (TPR) repeat protein
LALAYFYEELSLPENALKFVELAKAKAPNDWRVYTSGAHVLNRLNRFDQALEMARIARKLHANDPEVEYALGEALAAKNLYALSLSHLENAAQGLKPFNPNRIEIFNRQSPWTILARTYGALNEPKKAAEALTSKLKSTEPSFLPAILEERAKYHEQAGMYLEAANDYDSIVKDSPGLRDQDYYIMQRDLIRAKIGKSKDSLTNIRMTLESGKLKPVLQVQIFLKNQGFSDVAINGKYDDATRKTKIVPRNNWF